MSYVRENVLKAFTSTSSVVRIVITTASFGMGIDCPNIRRVIHWGTPEDIEQYVQETGCAGRDGEISHAILLHKYSTKSQRICKSMALMRVHAGELYYFKLSSFITVTVIQIIIVVAVMYASLYANLLNVLSFNF